MSHIQNILEKAEREGSVRRIRTTEAMGPVPVRPVDDNSTFVGASTMGMEPVATLADVPAAGAVPTLVPSRTVCNARLDRRLITMNAAESTAAEQYRSLRTRILHAETGAAVNVILITSPGRGDGKTLTTGNLGLTMAQEHQRRICIVDADLRNPQMHRMFGLPDGPGLADVLSGQASLDDALLTLEEHQVTILPAGRVEAHPAELLGTTAMRRTIDTLRSQFDCILIDAPATTLLADVGILTPLVDSVLLVVRAGVTSKPAIHEAVAAIDASKMLGVVLNEAA